MGNEVGTKVPPLDEIKDNEDVFLVLPSYAEPFSQKIRQIIFAEKQKLCKHKKYNAIFSKIKIRLAYTNNKSIKNLLLEQRFKYLKILLDLGFHLFVIWGFIYLRLGVYIVIMETN